MTDIFISYVEEDSIIAEELARGLEQAGYSVWYFERDSLPGLSYLKQTRDAIERSHVFILVLSPAALRSGQIDREVVRAHECERVETFIPLLHGVTHAEFQQRRPEWAQAMGAAASVRLPQEGVSAILPRILRALQTLGVEPQDKDDETAGGSDAAVPSTNVETREVPSASPVAASTDARDAAPPPTPAVPKRDAPPATRHSAGLSTPIRPPTPEKTWLHPFLLVRRVGAALGVILLVIILLTVGRRLTPRKTEPRMSLPPSPGQVMLNPVDGAEMVYVPPGEFSMGSESGEANEKPVHRVKITKGFWIYKTEVTNAQYKRFVEATGHREPKGSDTTAGAGTISFWQSPRFNAPRQPVVGVSWDDAVAYSAWAGCRLPTEAEWEYAARGTDGRVYPWGNEPPDSSRAVFSRTTAADGPGLCGELSAGASAFGVLDMAGNVWEWCSDWVGPYPDTEQVDPSGRPSGTERVVRGGCYSNDEVRYLRAPCRQGRYPAQAYNYLGFRLARSR